MEKVAAGPRAGSRWESSLGRRTGLVLGCCLACGGALAQGVLQQAQDAVAAEARTEAPVRLEVSTSTLPRLESQDTGFQAPRVDLSLLPQGRSGLGVAVGVTSFAARSGTALPGLAPRTGVDLGFRWRQMVHQQQVDVTAWRRMNTDDDAYSLIQQRQPVYGARVEMKLDSAKGKGFLAEKGFIGMQLESGAKISIKRKDGRPMVYYRTSF
jgi:hypothetical protein